MVAGRIRRLAVNVDAGKPSHRGKLKVKANLSVLGEEAFNWDALQVDGKERMDLRYIDP